MKSESNESGWRPEKGSRMLSEVAWSAIAVSMDLSLRHQQILQCIFDDEKEVMIADRLGISPHTVHTHVERIYGKLKVRSRLELVQLVLGEFLRLTADVTSGVSPICGYWVTQACPLCDKYGSSPVGKVSRR
jgi:DNA-binding NarL/FixJ family response regulator